jgi:hypothetical protein
LASGRRAAQCHGDDVADGDVTTVVLAHREDIEATSPDTRACSINW